MTDGTGVETWAALLATGAGSGGVILLGAWKLLLPRRDYEQAMKAQEEKCLDCRKRVDQTVSKEHLDLTLKPLRDEQEHRRRSMETLGQGVAGLSREVRGMDRKLTALLVHMKIDLRGVGEDG